MNSFRRRAYFANRARQLPTATKADFNILWLSDSIYNMDELEARVEAALSSSFEPNSVRATYGGEVIGAGLLELADRTQAYLNGAWTTCTRGLPYSYFRGLVFEYARNDAGMINAVGTESVADFRKAYDKILSQGYRHGIPRVVSGVCVPKCLANLSAWDASTDDYIILNLDSVIDTIVAKYNARHVDGVTLFQDLVTATTYTVAQLMRDTLHPTYTTGANVLGDAIAAKLLDGTPATNATPVITGDVVNYLYGEPSAGSWSLVDVSPNLVGPYDSPVFRIAGIAEKGWRVASNAARVVFPSTKCAQVWVHYFRQTSGGSFTIYIDRGLAAEKSLTINTTNQYHNYPQNQIVGTVGLDPAVAHTIEIVTTNATAVVLLGVTCVGVP